MIINLYYNFFTIRPCILFMNKRKLIKKYNIIIYLINCYYKIFNNCLIIKKSSNQVKNFNLVLFKFYIK